MHSVELDSGNPLTTLLGRQAETLQGIQLKSVGMRPEDWSDVLDVIVTMPGLTRISIHSLVHRGSSYHVISIGKTAFKAPLKELRLSETWASADLVTALISKASKTLEHVHLERYTAYGRSVCIFTSILAALKSCDKLTQLCVDGCMSPSLRSSSTLQFQEAMKAVKNQRPCGKNTHGPTIQENWALSHLPIDYGRSRSLDEWSPMEQNSYSADFESVPFRLGEVLRLVLSRGGNQDPCGFSDKHPAEGCRSHIFGCDRVYDQEGFAALPSWDEVVSEREARFVRNQAAQDEEDDFLATDMPW